MRASELLTIRAGSKMECVELCNFHFCCAFIFCQPMMVRPELLVNDILRRVALGTRTSGAGPGQRFEVWGRGRDSWC